MKSIITYRNSISFSPNRDIEVTKLEFIKLIKIKLEKLKAIDLKQMGDNLVYTAGIFRFVWNGNLLSPISEGCVQVEIHENKIIVNYEIQFLEVFLMSLFTGILASFIVENIIAKILVFPIVILWFFGLIAGITIFRYNLFIKRIISRVLEIDTHKISKEQVRWISDETKCDACGFKVNPTDNICPDCGIRLI